MEQRSKTTARWISVEEMLEQIENEETERAYRGRVSASAIAPVSTIRPHERQTGPGRLSSATAGRPR